MGNATELEILKNPPAYAIVRVENDVVHIKLPLVVARWLKITMRCVAPVFFIGLFAFPVAASAATHGTPTTSHVALLVAWAAVWLLLGLAVLVYLLMGTIATEILYDAAQGTLRVRDQMSFFTIPTSDIVGIGVVQSKRRVLDLDASLPPNRMFRHRPEHALDIRTADGRLRCFAGRDREKIEFLADVLTQLPHDVELNSQSASDEVIVLATRTYGATPRWLARLGIAAGILMLVWSAWEGVPAWQSRSWPTVRGEVTHAKWEATRKKGRDTHYVAEMKYRYLVNSSSYTGDRIGFGRLPESGYVREFISAHPNGSAIDVFYDPEQPQRSTLTRGGGWFVLLPFIGAAVTFASSLPFLFRRSTPAQDALAAKYRVTPPPSPAHAMESDLAKIRWTEAPAIAAAAWRDAKLLVVRMTARTVAVSTLAAFAIRYFFERLTPELPWDMLMWGAALWPMLMYGSMLALLFWRAPRPRTYGITTVGIVRPLRERPLLRWTSFDSFEVEEYDLVLHGKDSGCKRIDLPEDAELARTIVEEVERHLPQRPPLAKHSNLIRRDWLIGFAALVGYVALLTWMFSSTGIRRGAGVEGYVLFTLVLGPGTIVAPFLWRRRASAAIIGMAVMLNFLGMFTTLLIVMIRHVLPIT